MSKLFCHKIQYGVVRDSSGEGITGFQINLGIGEMLEAEAWGYFMVSKVAQSCNVAKLVIESDSA
ncbi:hypothetical protein PSY47_23660, partial [Shigella flexneri]|nr:hypothetical protein [Shigella flexneri]